MTKTIIINSSEYSILIISAIISFIPLTKYSRIRPKILYPLILISMTALSFLLGVAEALIGIENTNVLLMPTLVVTFIIYIKILKIPIFKLVYGYLNVIAMMSFSGFINYLVEARIFPDAEYTKPSSWGLLVQWIVALLFMLGVIGIRKKYLWVYENFHNKKMWIAACFVPIIISTCHIMMIPKYYYTISVARIFKVSIIIEGVLFSLFIVFQLVFYQIAKTTYEKFAAENKANMTAMLKRQYESLTSYMEQTSRLRHDFRQSIRTINELTISEKYDELHSYVSNCDKEYNPEHTQYSFCEHVTVNALLSYYASIAKSNGIRIIFDVSLPKCIDVEDVDFSTIFGNLLENAIHACERVVKEKRYIRITADINTPHRFFLVMQNSYDGKLQFDSTNNMSKSIGLMSISLTADKYHGVTRFYTSENEYVSNVMLSI